MTEKSIDDLPRYRATEPVYLGTHLINTDGEFVSDTANPGRTWTAANRAAERMIAKRDKRDDEIRAEQAENAPRSAPPPAAPAETAAAVSPKGETEKLEDRPFTPALDKTEVAPVRIAKPAGTPTRKGEGKEDDLA